MADLDFVSEGFIKFLKDSNQPLDKLSERNLENLYKLIFKIEFERNQNTDLGNLTYPELSSHMVARGLLSLTGENVTFNLN